MVHQIADLKMFQWTLSRKTKRDDEVHDVTFLWSFASCPAYEKFKVMGPQEERKGRSCSVNTNLQSIVRRGGPVAAFRQWPQGRV